MSLHAHMQQLAQGAPADLRPILAQAMLLQPGDPMPGIRINPTVSAIHQREAYAASSIYVATHRVTFSRTLDEIAAAIGEPLNVQDTLFDMDPIEARAVLAGAIEGERYVKWLYRGRTQGNPVTGEAIAKAVKLVGDALSVRLLAEAA